MFKNEVARIPLAAAAKTAVMCLLTQNVDCTLLFTPFFVDAQAKTRSSFPSIISVPVSSIFHHQLGLRSIRSCALLTLSMLWNSVLTCSYAWAASSAISLLLIFCIQCLGALYGSHRQHLLWNFRPIRRSAIWRYFWRNRTKLIILHCKIFRWSVFSPCDYYLAFF